VTNTNMSCVHAPRLRLYEQRPAGLTSLALADVMAIATRDQLFLFPVLAPLY